MPDRAKTIAILSNYVPIQCGISTFAKNLYESISRQRGTSEVVVIGVDDGQDPQQFPSEVVLQISKNKRLDYTRAADYINSSNIDVVCIQHEYGIYGGVAGDYLLDTVSRLRKPFVVTLHTVLDSPSADQRRVMAGLIRRAEKLVVMSERAVGMLKEVYDVPAWQISMIHHGVPDAFSITPDVRSPFGIEGKMLTFGLLSPDKGIENVIKAMPRIVEACPRAHYQIVGATHPHIKAEYGEAYRDSLQSLARTTGVEKHIEFVNRFLNPCEIVDYLEQADIYVTPYLKKEQITSGTLAYAIGSGKAVISTPYWYAEELLVNERGVIVPTGQSEPIADAAIRILTNDEHRLTMQQRARELGKSMSWRSVGAQYLRMMEDMESKRSVEDFGLLKITQSRRHVPELNLSHLRRMTDETGILQHALYNLPRYAEGYCLDDNCRALLLTGMISSSTDLPPIDLDDLSSKYLAFVAYALDNRAHRFRNFMSYSGEWLENEGSEDSQGRALWSLGGFAARTSDPSQARCASALFLEALPATAKWTSPRAWAYAILGITEFFGTATFHREMEERCEALTAQLLEVWRASSRPEWNWVELYLSYWNARMPQALIRSAAIFGDPEIEQIGLQTLDWLWRQQCDSRGFFEPLGCNWVYYRNQSKPRFDQQPVEVCASVSACVDAWHSTGDPIWKDRAWQAYEWFLGANPLGQRLCDPSTGGCFDGLHETSVNQNQGAESTISFLMATLEVSRLKQVRQSVQEKAKVM